MKTITRLLKPLLPVVAALFFCTVASAQTLSQLTTAQSELQTYIAAATLKTASPNLSAQDLATLQAEIAAAQTKLTGINTQIAFLQQDQQRVQTENAVAQRQAALNAQQAAPPAHIVGQPAPSNAITTPRDPNHPSNVPLFKSTGNAEQDAALLRQWQQAHPIVK
jgi:septal ring factor EnvC (AmiA/AmiB activator)